MAQPPATTQAPEDEACRWATSWELQATTGEPVATVRLTDYQGYTTGPHDAWGRPGKPQPVLVSVEVVLARKFDSSVLGDDVKADTVHYGKLGKELRSTLKNMRAEPGPDKLTKPKPLSLADVVDKLGARFLGFSMLDKPGGQPVKGESYFFANNSNVKRLSITVTLPKASLVGTGVSLTASVVLKPDKKPAEPKLRGSTLKFRELRVPTLIGLNDNEREAKQMVIISVEIDRWTYGADSYTGLEKFIVESVAKSEFKTLETLADVLCVTISRKLHSELEPELKEGWRLKISLEKPIAVPFAEAPCVELTADTADLILDGRTASRLYAR